MSLQERDEETQYHHACLSTGVDFYGSPGIKGRENFTYST